MGAVLPLTGFAHAKTFYRFGQNHRGLAFVVYRSRIGRVYLVRVMAAAIQAPDIVVGHRGDHFFKLRVFTEKVFAHIGAIAGFVVLVFAVDGFHHAPLQQAVGIFGEQRIPVAPPNRFDDIPARATEIGFEFLDNFAVTANRAIEPLQVAVDNKNKIVETFARGERDGTQGFRLVHFAIAHKRPHLATLGIDDATVVQVFHKTRLVDRLQRPQAHRHRGELPKIWHQPRMRVARNAVAIDLLTELHHLVFGEAAFEKGARVDAG